jgi:hypothetical protein
VYAATLVPLVLLARRLADDPQASAARPGRCVAAVAPSWAVTGVAVCLLALPALWESLIDRGTIGELPAPVAPRLDGWDGPVVARRDWRPRFPGALVTGAWSYERNAAVVHAYVAACGAQAPRRKLVEYPSSIAGEDASEPSATRVLRVGCDGLDEPLVERRLRTRGRERLVWSWYEVHGARVASARAALASVYDAGFERWRVAADSKNGAGERGNACRAELAGRSSR